MKLNPYEDSMFSLRDTAAHGKCAWYHLGKEPAMWR